jgi:hypothetical protein
MIGLLGTGSGKNGLPEIVGQKAVSEKERVDEKIVV